MSDFMNLSASDSVQLLWWGGGLCLLGVYLAGAGGHLVVWKDFSDLTDTVFFLVISVLAFFAVGFARDFDSAWDSPALDVITLGMLWVAAIGAVAGALFLMVREFLVAARLNGSVFAGLLVGTFRIIFIPLLAILLLGKDGDKGKRQSPGAEAFLFIIAVALLLPLVKETGLRVRQGNI